MWGLMLTGYERLLGKTGAQEPTRGLLPVVSEMQVKNLEEEKAIGPLSGVVNISGRF